MSATHLLRRSLLTLREAPLIRQTRQRAYERRFATAGNVNYYRGVYDSFEAAAAAAPATKPLGYDNPAAAALYDDDTVPFLKDYPAALWLQRSFQEGMRSVFDLGGHAGVKYYALDGRVDYPADMQWLVCDVPAVAERGRALAATRDSSRRLAFTSDFAAGDGLDIFYASGSLQYLPVTLAQILAGYTAKPRRLVINTTAIHPTRSFFTLNSIGAAFCPYRVAREDEFIESVASLGYRLRDKWHTPKDFVIPFEKGYDLDHFTGFCFDLASRA